MSGWPRWASEAPSLRSTSEWTSDCGWTTTSIRSYGTPKRWWASIASKPLFISVAESIVIRPPMRQVGCARASSTETPERSVRPRKGPPDAVSTRRSTVPGGSAPISWKSAECSESTGSRRQPPCLGEGHRQLAADHQALLVGEGDVDPLAERDDRRAQPGGADDPVEDEVGAGGGDQLAHPLLAGEDLSVPAGAGGLGGLGVGEGDRGDAVPPGLLDRELPA